MKVTIKKQFLYVLFLLLIPVWASAQVIAVKGTVKDNKGESLVGVSILEAGTKNGTITDINGNYALKVSKNAKLNVSYIGYVKKTVAVDGHAVLNIELEEESRSLSEVVVVGYGKMKRTDVTGSISTVNSDAISKSVVTSLDQVLQGRAAGVQVQQNSGEPGGGASVRIRGITSITGNNEPIYVIDGVIIDGNSGSSASNPLATIDPADIVSMDILKDASATAIYGSRGATGVIQITTKRGKAGEARVSYNGYTGWQEMPGKLDLLNLSEYATLRNQQAAAGVVQYNNNFVRPDLIGEGTDWQDELFSRAVMTNHNLNITGGTDKSTYSISLGYLNQNGIAVGSGFKRYNLRSNVETQIKKWLKMGLDVSFFNSNQKLTVSDESLVKIAMKQTPDVAARNADGTFDGPQTKEFVQNNPLGLAMIKENYKENIGTRGNVFFDATLIKGLSYRPEFSFDYGTDNGYKFSPSYTFGSIVNTTILSERAKSFRKGWTLRNLLNYNTTFGGKNSLTLMMGQEAQRYGWNYLNASSQGFPSNSSHDLDMGTTNYTAGETSYFSTINSYFGRAFFSYDDRYLLTATMRYDGSSKLAPGHQWHAFPSTALAWKVSNESFLKDNPTIYNLKLRLGWGLVGNQGAGTTAYPQKSTLKTVETIWGTGLLTRSTANPNLKWETTSSSNIGVDLGLFKGRIDLTADLYYKHTKDLLLELPLPAYVGTTGMGSSAIPWANIGTLENKGFEISINTVNIDKRDFKWKSNVVFSLNRNKVLSINTQTGVSDMGVQEGSETNIVTRTAPGYSVGMFYGYKVIGRFEKATDFYYKDKSGAIKPVALPTGMSISPTGAWIGDYIFEDINKDGVIDEKDRTFIGNPAPKFTYGFGNSFTYKNWDLSVMLNGSYGGKVVNYQRRWLENPRSTTNVLTKAMNYAVLSKIDPNGPVDYRNLYISSGDADMCRMAASAASSTSNFRYSDKFVEDGSYLRIQNISIGYNLPKSILKKVKIENLKLYANLQNVYTFTAYKGYEPEVGSINQDARLSSIDNARYPSPRIYTFGLNLSF